MEKRRNKTFIRNKKEDINRGYLPFWGEYQIYLIECVENISNFTSAYKKFKKILVLLPFFFNAFTMKENTILNKKKITSLKF